MSQQPSIELSPEELSMVLRARQQQKSKSSRKLKSKGQMAFTRQELVENREMRMIHDLYSGRMLETMETDQENKTQHFFVFSLRPVKGGWALRFARTVYRPDGNNQLLDPSDPHDAELISEHFRTARYRYNMVEHRKKSAEFMLPNPVRNPNQAQPDPIPRQKEYLREQFDQLMKTRLNYNHLHYDRENDMLDTSVWDHQLRGLMRSYSVTHPLPSQPKSKV